jgi:hypothetical protein
MARADKSALISKAVAAFRAGEFADYSKAATHFGVDRTSVSKRVRGLTKTRQEANSFYHQCLTNVQEEVREVGKNWVGQFVKRHKNRLKSLYLRNIDNLRVSAKYALMF